MGDRDIHNDHAEQILAQYGFGKEVYPAVLAASRLGAERERNRIAQRLLEEGTYHESRLEKSLTVSLSATRHRLRESAMAEVLREQGTLILASAEEPSKVLPAVPMTAAQQRVLRSLKFASQWIPSAQVRAVKALGKLNMVKLVDHGRRPGHLYRWHAEITDVGRAQLRALDSAESGLTTQPKREASALVKSRRYHNEGDKACR